MGRNTITDVRKRLNILNERWMDDKTLTFQCWGVGRNKYQLLVKETGKQYGKTCVGATEFLKLLSGFEAGRRL